MLDWKPATPDLFQFIVASADVKFKVDEIDERKRPGYLDLLLLFSTRLS